MLPIPPPTRSGHTRTTESPLYWATWGPAGAPRLIVLHGGPGAHHDYLLPQMLELAREHELLFYDQRGGGQSRTDDRAPVTWRTHVADLARVLQEFDVKSPTIVGYSWGGLLAMLHAIETAREPSALKPARLVLIDPAPVNRAFRHEFETEFARRQKSAAIEALRAELGDSGLRERDQAAYRQRVFEISVAGYFADPHRARDLTPFRITGRVQQSVWESLGEYDLLAPGMLERVHVPALVVHGREDPIPLASSEAAARALGARLVVLDGSGHVPYVEQPAALFGAIETFLTRS